MKGKKKEEELSIKRKHQNDFVKAFKSLVIKLSQNIK